MPRFRTAALALSLACLLSGSAHAGDDPPKKGVALSKFFRGKVLSIEKHAYIELEYSFDDAAELRDFEETIPFRAVKTISRKIEKGRIRLKGTGSLRHKAVFKDLAGGTAVVQPVRNRDFGFAISESRESEVFTLYCAYDRYFGSTDNVHTPQNMIIKFLARDPKRNADGLQDWRYCGSRGPKPEIKRGGRYTVSCRREGMKSQLNIGEWVSKGKETGRDLTTMMVALYGYDGDVRVESLIVRGRLDPEFVRKHNLDVTPLPKKKKKAKADDGAPTGPQHSEEEIARIRAQIDDYPTGTSPRKLAKLLKDAAIAAALRQEAAQKALDHGSKKIVRWLLDGMYAEDETARKLSFEVFKGLTGKSFGYRAGASVESRNRAVKKMADFVKKNAAQFQ